MSPFKKKKKKPLPFSSPVAVGACVSLCTSLLEDLKPSAAGPVSQKHWQSESQREMTPRYLKVKKIVF